MGSRRSRGSASSWRRLSVASGGHDGRVPQIRSINPRRSQIIWLVVIVAVGVAVGILAGAWWGVGAAVILLAISEVIERVQRSRT
jgi:hypothetical protein